MWIGDVAKIASEKTLRMAQRLRDYRGTDMKRVHSDWSTMVIYQQAQIECLMRNVKALCLAHTDEGHGHEFDPKLDWPIGTTETQTLPPVKFTHEAEFHEFLSLIRGKISSSYHADFDISKGKLARKLFGRELPFDPRD